MGPVGCGLRPSQPDGYDWLCASPSEYTAREWGSLPWSLLRIWFLFEALVLVEALVFVEALVLVEVLVLVSAGDDEG